MPFYLHKNQASFFIFSSSLIKIQYYYYAHIVDYEALRDSSPPSWVSADVTKYALISPTNVNYYQGQIDSPLDFDQFIELNSIDSEHFDKGTLKSHTPS